jgi:hypothetical protein
VTAEWGLATDTLGPWGPREEPLRTETRLAGEPAAVVMIAALMEAVTRRRIGFLHFFSFPVDGLYRPTTWQASLSGAIVGTFRSIPGLSGKLILLV